jgi:hypothetical protein
MTEDSVLSYKPPVLKYTPPVIEYEPAKDGHDDRSPDALAANAYVIRPRHVVIRKRVIWLPLAVLLTAVSILYISSSKPSYDEPFDPATSVGVGHLGGAGVQALVASVVDVCSRRSSSAEDVESSLDRLRAGLRAKYVRVTPGVVIASGCVVAWELLS